MANPEHLAKLKEGVQAWNEWRRSLPEPAFDSGFSSEFQTGPDLSYADLSRTNLSHSNLSDTNLCGTILSHTNLFGANLRGAVLIRANLFSANLTGAILTSVNLFEAGLSGVNFFDAKGLTQAEVEHASGDRTTRLPEGLEYPEHWLGDGGSGAMITETDTALPVTAIKTPPALNVPSQEPAPLEVRWDRDLLVASDRPIPARSASNKKGQQANFDKLRGILEELDGDPRGANSAPEVGKAVAAYKEALGESLKALHGFNVGFAGLVLADAFRAAADDLSDGYRGKLQALLTLSDHLVSQDPEWADYVSHLRASKITLQADKQAEQSADEVISVFEDLTEVISPGVAARLRALRRSANRVRQMDPKVLKPLWDSFENILRALGARVVEDWSAASSEISDAVQILQEQLGPPLADGWDEGKGYASKGSKKAFDLTKKAATDLGKETYKKLVQFGGAGGALYILWLAHPQLLKISQILGFTWLEHLLNFISKLAGV